jgi:hypothetical protein
MKNCKQKEILISIGVLLLFLVACGPSEEQIAATKTHIAFEIFQTQTAAATPTYTPSPTFNAYLYEHTHTHTRPLQPCRLEWSLR